MFVKCNGSQSWCNQLSLAAKCFVWSDCWWPLTSSSHSCCWTTICFKCAWWSREFQWKCLLLTYPLSDLKTTTNFSRGIKYVLAAYPCVWSCEACADDPITASSCKEQWERTHCASWSSAMTWQYYGISARWLCTKCCLVHAAYKNRCYYSTLCSYLPASNWGGRSHFRVVKGAEWRIQRGAFPVASVDRLFHQTQRLTLTHRAKRVCI